MTFGEKLLDNKLSSNITRERSSTLPPVKKKVAFHLEDIDADEEDKQDKETVKMVSDNLQMSYQLESSDSDSAKRSQAMRA